jgi:clan AA aspartic protease
VGYVRVKGLIGNSAGTVVRETFFLVDTGAFYTTISPKLAEELGVKSLARTRLVLADKRSVEVDTALAYIKILDREAVFQIAILDVPEPLLGVTALEGLGIKVDPNTGKVEYSRPYGVALLKVC